jgi:GxxExxY protein
MDALELEFSRAALDVRREAPVPVYYEAEGEAPVRLPHLYTADFVIEGKILVVVKAEGDTGRSDDYALQTLLYAARMPLAILLQFRDKRVQVSRVCRYSPYLNSRNVGREREAIYAGKWEEKDVVLTGAEASD